ncbi:unnamed protein product [Bathycoccus prasinos]
MTEHILAIAEIESGMIDWDAVFEGVEWFHWTEKKVMAGLTEYCDIILGNEEDAEKHFGIHPEGLDVHKDGADVKAEAFLSVCKQMMKKFPKAKKVYYGTGSKMYETRQYQITDIVDRVGGGDSFMGGLIYGLLKYPEDDQNALDFAIETQHSVFTPQRMKVYVLAIQLMKMHVPAKTGL